jgi:hypothetical protein
VADETMVRVYKGNDAYQKDARKLADQGWRVVNVVERRPRAGCLRILLLWWLTLLRPPRPELVVTYARARA